MLLKLTSALTLSLLTAHSAFACGFVHPLKIVMFEPSFQTHVRKKAESFHLICKKSYDGTDFIARVDADLDGIYAKFPKHRKLPFTATVDCQTPDGQKQPIEITGTAVYTWKKMSPGACEKFKYITVSNVQIQEP